MKILETCSIPAIAALCYGWIEVLKHTLKNDKKLKNAYPFLSGLFGSALGTFTYLAEPSVMVTDSVLNSAFAGMISGLSATGIHEMIQRMRKYTKIEPEDDRPVRYYITGDKHRHFDQLIEFCEKNHLRRKDVIVILGDSGFNYYGDERDDKLKAKLARVQVTLFCLYGNKENRPQNIPTYGIRSFCGGTVYYEPKYPSIFFAKDGETYNFNGKEFMVIGGGHSVDKLRCVEEGLPFFEDEMPSDKVKSLVERRLAERGNQIYGLLTHTCPISCLPTEMFVSTKRAADDQKPITSKWKARQKAKQDKKRYPLDIDRSTEEWLETLMINVDFSEWYCGHYHIDKELYDIRMMYKDILPFCVAEEE